MKPLKILLVGILLQNYHAFNMMNNTTIPSNWKYLSVLNIKQMTEKEIVSFTDYYKILDNQKELFENNTPDTINRKMLELILRTTNFETFVMGADAMTTISTAQLINGLAKWKSINVKEDALPPNYNKKVIISGNMTIIITFFTTTVIFAASLFWQYRQQKHLVNLLRNS